MDWRRPPTLALHVAIGSPKPKELLSSNPKPRRARYNDNPRCAIRPAPPAVGYIGLLEISSQQQEEDAPQSSGTASRESATVDCEAEGGSE